MNFFSNIYMFFLSLSFDPDTDIFYHVYTNGIGSYRAYKISHSRIMTHFERIVGSDFDSSRGTRIFVHGAQREGSVDKDFEFEMKKSYQNYNGILVDWSRAFSELYYPMKSRRFLVAERLAALINMLVSRNGGNKKSENMKRFVIIGFSLGAHVGGITGKILRHKYGLDLEVLIALDPANPLFSVSNSIEGLNSESAKYVQVIHSSVGRYGIARPLGHADFYPDGGKEHPECGLTYQIFDNCNHAVAFQTYAESIHWYTSYGKGERPFPSIKCRSYEEIASSKCSVYDTTNPYIDENGNENFMGGETNAQTEPKPHGIFYLETKSGRLYDQTFSVGFSLPQRIKIV